MCFPHVNMGYVCKHSRYGLFSHIQAVMQIHTFALAGTYQKTMAVNEKENVSLFCLLSFLFSFSLSRMMAMFIARLVSRYTAFWKFGEHMKWRKMEKNIKGQIFQPATILVTIKMIPTTQQKPYSKWMHCTKKHYSHSEWLAHLQTFKHSYLDDFY